MPQLEGSKGSKASKDTLREGQNPSQNGGPGELQAGQARPLVENERGGVKARRVRRSRRNKEASRPSSPEIERPGTLTRRQAEALQHAYTRGVASMEKLSQFFGLSLSTVSKYCSGLNVTPHPDDTTPIVTQAVSITPEPSGNGGNGAHPDPRENSEGTELPRRSYEITATRPVIVEENNGNEVPHSLEPHVAFTNQAWETIRLMIHGSAMREGYSDPLEYFNGVILVDLRTADLVRTLVPHHDVDSLRRNLNTIVRKAVAYDKARQDVGLAETEDQTGKPSHPESEGPTK